ncbi:hypothetical protein SAMN04488589_0029 [Methanolobus vulcani]|jgi:hypothetical protein|uniref:Uncharacterized protein n=1 Tax=Methanolobus vulcani TaxID=38026 RepID=A0A7Z7AU42_9EURY|nr:hypothetical protein [Methanolobus sp.]MDK2947252.1 hypothetical protein [Methanolobus sp.]SDF22246.1 hypothetical protein SAMN04488589_0029 [Methanolobus vulcani]
MAETVANLNTIHVPEGYSLKRIQFYFWLGLFSAVFLRLIIIADYYNGILSKALFYLGVLGYLVFFAHRYHVATRRVEVLRNLELLSKIESRTPLSEEDYHGLQYIMWSLSVSKERMNYLVIFAFSVIAIVLSLALDLGIV